MRFASFRKVTLLMSRERIERRDKLALVYFVLIVFLMCFLQYMQYYDVNSKAIKNIVVLLICFESLYAAITKYRYMLIDKKCFSIILFLLYAVFSEIITNTFTIENLYYLSVPFLTIIGGYSFAESYSKMKIKMIVKVTALIVFCGLTFLFLVNFHVLGFLNAGVQTSLVYPLMFFVLIACYYSDNIVMLCAIPMLYAGFLLMSRTTILLVLAVMLIKIFRSENNMHSIVKKIFILLIFIVALVYIYNYVLKDSGSDILKKTTLRNSDISSGRFNIYGNSIGYFFNSSAIRMILGNGSETASRLFGISGHSDFIQFLLNFGIIGLVWFTNIQIFCINGARKNGLETIKYIEFAVLLTFITINQFFLTVGPSTLYGLLLGMFAGTQSEYSEEIHGD